MGLSCMHAEVHCIPESHSLFLPLSAIVVSLSNSANMSQSYTTVAASNAIELELPSKEQGRRRQRKHASPFIYVELDRRITTAKQDASEGCIKADKDERKSDLDRQTKESKRRTRSARHESRAQHQSCATDWLGPLEDSIGEGQAGPIASLGSFLLYDHSPSNTHNEIRKDCRSTSSEDDSIDAYFSPSDFQNVHWARILKQHMTGPTVSVVVIAIATALTHPLVFLVGALTALGTAHVTQVGYQYYYDEKPEREEKSHVRNSIVDCTADPWLCWQKRSQETTETLTDHEIIPAAKQQGEKGPLVSSPKSRQIDIQGEQWLSQFYPTLKTNLLPTCEKFAGLNALEFFQVFYANDAPYNFIECQKQRGDMDIHYGLWKKVDKQVAPLSLHPRRQQRDVTNVYNVERVTETGPIICVQERVITFKAKTHSLLGPSYASTIKTQRFLLLSKRLAMLESRTDFADIPFYDRFCVVERWVIRAEKEMPGKSHLTVSARSDDIDLLVGHHRIEKQHYSCDVSASCEVVFMQPCPFEYQINKQASSALIEVSRAWCSMAQEALQLAEQAKCNRLMGEDSNMQLEKRMPCAPELNAHGDIEVEYVSPV